MMYKCIPSALIFLVASACASPKQISDQVVTDNIVRKQISGKDTLHEYAEKKLLTIRQVSEQSPTSTDYGFEEIEGDDLCAAPNTNLDICRRKLLIESADIDVRKNATPISSIDTQILVDIGNLDEESFLAVVDDDEQSLDNGNIAIKLLSKRNPVQENSEDGGSQPKSENHQADSRE